jgi:hypothetical protein
MQYILYVKKLYQKILKINYRLIKFNPDNDPAYDLVLAHSIPLARMDCACGEFRAAFN